MFLSWTFLTYWGLLRPVVFGWGVVCDMFSWINDLSRAPKNSRRTRLKRLISNKNRLCSESWVTVLGCVYCLSQLRCFMNQLRALWTNYDIALTFPSPRPFPLFLVICFLFVYCCSDVTQMVIKHKIGPSGLPKWKDIGVRLKNSFHEVSFWNICHLRTPEDTLLVQIWLFCYKVSF